MQFHKAPKWNKIKKILNNVISTHSTPLSCNSKEILHAGLPAWLWQLLLFSLLSLTFPCLMELRQPLTDPALATNTTWTQAEQLLRPEGSLRGLSTHLICVVRQRNSTRASSSGSVQVSSAGSVRGASRNIFRASLYFQKSGTGWVWCRN